jgi:hypothetical protein
MKKTIITILFASINFFLFGQAKPDWMDNDARNAKFPPNAFFTGFAQRVVEKGVAQETEQAKLDAQADLTKQIRLLIKTTTQSNIAAQSVNGQYDERESFENKSSSETKAELVSAKTDTWFDQKANTVYAFAYAARADLIAFYTQQINVDLNKVETAIEVSSQLVEVGKKMSARRKIDDAKQVLGGVTAYRDMLVAVDAAADETALQTDRFNNLQRTVEKLLTTLEQSTFVYVDCQFDYKGYKDDAFSSDPGILCDIIKQALSENECSVTENKDEADYELNMTTYTTQRSDGKGQYGIISYYANAKGSLYNRLTQKVTANFSILNDADAYAAGRSAEDAATKAFKLPALKNKILEKILPKIKN